MNKNKFILIAIVIQLFLALIIIMISLGSYLTGKYSIESAKDNSIINSYYSEIDKLVFISIFSVVVNVILWIIYLNLKKDS